MKIRTLTFDEDSPKIVIETAIELGYVLRKYKIDDCSLYDLERILGLYERLKSCDIPERMNTDKLMKHLGVPHEDYIVFHKVMDILGWKMKDPYANHRYKEWVRKKGKK